MNIFERAMDYLYEKYHMSYDSDLKGLPIGDITNVVGDGSEWQALIDADVPVGKQVV